MIDHMPGVIIVLSPLLQSLKDLLGRGEPSLPLATLTPTIVNTAVAKWDRNHTLLDNTLLLVAAGDMEGFLADSSFGPYFQPTLEIDRMAAGRLGQLGRALVVSDGFLVPELRFIERTALMRPASPLQGL